MTLAHCVLCVEGDEVRRRKQSPFNISEAKQARTRAHKPVEPKFRWADKALVLLLAFATSCGWWPRNFRGALLIQG